MHICLLCIEIFSWGKYGGFGRATRFIGRELVKRGIKVTAIVPKRKNQNQHEVLDGIREKKVPIKERDVLWRFRKRCVL